MTGDSARARGEAMFGKVYGAVVPLPAAETRDDYVNTVIDHLFGTIWTRSTMSIKDRRLVILGVAIAQGEDGIIEVQLRAALGNGELSLAEIEEILVLMPNYVGYPRAGRLQAIVRKLQTEAAA